ncbi:TldD/PmbA family protein [Sulfolobus acidocaldarius]|uniref:Conserved Archaeal protein n=4 Tax=Sulfolobus acidocaldarius TaxID=2285 RepID=Q4J9Z9_SULAC|nr:TldD/PmbA family protein [Sulfolobus acidocaldarius]AAY80375.1 conserved Archaeal protein [Sulfolobus acidocaldarius DSM 639]AGE70958.1 hypothetical protein SacN8_04935 [Sulfolobus acidocaldarius N8]AGE73229.1 hypothetical protein SacRon12I_04925 [Sulfolobus acidocaldarius Ron12/I]ALU28738.1 hypothetical protein ATY89_01370 [Sulfolobus acidocaldarius]ALU31457.1 hypothetical protein ATZ20_04405 [Sulfolobus acidocaldarius]
MNENLISVLNKLRGFDEVEVGENKVTRLLIKFVNSEVATIQKLIDVNYGIMVRKGNRYFMYSGTNLDVEEAKNGFEVSSGAQLYPILSRNDREFVIDQNNENLREIVEKERIDGIISEIGKAELPISGVISIYETTTNLVTSYGFNGSERRYKIDGYVRAFNKEYSGQWAFFSESPNDIKDTIKKAVEFASITNRVKLDDGKYNVVMSPLVVANLMGFFADFASAFSVITGSSFLAKFKVGDRIASDLLTISDIPIKAGIRSFDDEAEFTRDKKIIDSGIFQSLLFNNELGQLMGQKSTGNAGIISPNAFAIDLQEGNMGVESMTSGNVILLNNVWYTRFQNYYEGSFSTVGRDAVVVYKDGKPIGVADRIRISDTLPNILRNVQALSKEKYGIRWWDATLPTYSPFILVENVNISSSK